MRLTLKNSIIRICDKANHVKSILAVPETLDNSANEISGEQ